MSELLGKSVLILNADYRPISYYPLSVQSMKKVLKAVFKKKLNILEEYDETINIGGTTIHLPKTAILKKYIHTHQTPKFSRYNVYLRDKFTCQYCGKRFPSTELTFDHVLPRYKGGKTDWNNIITACKCCNGKKGCKDAKGKYVPLSIPHVPSNAELLRNLKDLQLDVGSQLKNWENWINNI
jgi:5-methylcytosine-specific restriction endonuclease McrA